MTAKAKQKSALNFEQSLERLEETIRALEAGDLGLDEALSRFEEGVRLSKECRQRLESVEGRIAELLESGEVRTITPDEP